MSAEGRSQYAESKPTSSQPQQLPTQLRHRGHADPCEARLREEDLTTPPHADAAVMTREPADEGQDDASEKAAKMAAVARGQANSSEVQPLDSSSSWQK